MREILFRGKRKSNGEWIEGSLLNFQKNSYIIPCDIKYCFENAERFGFDIADFEVIPETVGQYIGLTDKNGVKIFEGDIIQVKYGIRDDIIINFEVCWEKNDAGFYPIYDYDSLYSVKAEYSEVIENIYENPELLK